MPIFKERLINIILRKLKRNKIIRVTKPPLLNCRVYSKYGQLFNAASAGSLVL